MIEINSDKGRNFPIIYCDICNREIREYGMAAAVYSRDAGEGRKPVHLVHKGRCHDAMDLKLGYVGSPWMELRSLGLSIG